MSEINNPEQRVVVVGPDGLLLPPDGPASPAEAGKPQEGGGITDLVEEPAKVLRIGTMIKQLLDEVKSAPLDEASRTRMREIHHVSIKELEEGLAPELREELRRLSLPFSEDGVPSEGELRIAQAQLVGWLEGLFHGIQTTVLAQQMTMRAQVEAEMRRRALPGAPADPGRTSTGQYL